MYVSALCTVNVVPTEAKECMELHRTIITEHCKLPCGYWEVHPDFLKEQQVL